MKIATFNINNVNKRLPNLLDWLRAREARRRLPAGAEGRRRRISEAGDREGRLRRGLARRRRPGTASPSSRAARADRDAHRAAGRSRRHAKPLHRGGGQRRADRLALCAERQSAAGPEVRLQARLDGAARPRTPPSSTPPACRSCWRATTTSCRPTATSTRPSPTTTTRCCSRRAAPPFRAPARRRAGSTRSARCIRTRRCTRSGTTCGTAGRATPGLRLDHLLLSAEPARSAWSTPGSIATCAARRTPAIMRRPGSCCATRGNSATATSAYGRGKPSRKATGSAQPRRRATSREAPARAGRCW